MPFKPSDILNAFIIPTIQNIVKTSDHIGGKIILPSPKRFPRLVIVSSLKTTINVAIQAWRINLIEALISNKSSKVITKIIIAPHISIDKVVVSIFILGVFRSFGVMDLDSMSETNVT